METGNKSKKLHIIIMILIIIVLLATIIIFFNFRSISDSFKASAFEPSPEILTIENNLGLTEKGKTIFRASEPELRSASAIKSDCPASQSVVVLGCYNNSKISINRDESNSNKLAETTAAHELLHAIYFRLQDDEIERLKTDLNSVYGSASKDFLKTLDPYSADEVDEELYVRAAIQLETLPENLEKHYKQYFNSREALYEFYQESKAYELKTGKLIY